MSRSLEVLYLSGWREGVFEARVENIFPGGEFCSLNAACFHKISTSKPQCM